MCGKCVTVASKTTPMLQEHNKHTGDNRQVDHPLPHTKPFGLANPCPNRHAFTTIKDPCGTRKDWATMLAGCEMRHIWNCVNKCKKQGGLRDKLCETNGTRWFTIVNNFFARPSNVLHVLAPFAAGDGHGFVPASPDWVISLGMLNAHIQIRIQTTTGLANTAKHVRDKLHVWCFTLDSKPEENGMGGKNVVSGELNWEDAASRSWDTTQMHD